MSNRSLQLNSTLYKYLLNHSLREPELLKKLREETSGLTGSTMQISPEQGQFMRLLVQLIGARRIIEIGVYTGYSSLSMALGLPEEGQIVACDINEDFTGVARRYWKSAGVVSRIDLRIAPALETLEQLTTETSQPPFDMAFIDADKGNYSNYYEALLPQMRKGGLIVVDNVLWSGSVADDSIQNEDTNAIRTFNRMLHSDERIDMSLLPVGDGLTLARKR